MATSRVEIAKALGVTPSAVTRAIRAGRLTPNADGSFDDLAAAVAEFRGKTKPRARRAHGSKAAAGRYAESRARREQHLAELAEIQVSQARARLVDAADVRAAGARAGVIVRTVLENLPDQLASELARETDEGKLHALLSERVEEILKDLAQRFTASVEGVAPPVSLAVDLGMPGAPAGAHEGEGGRRE